MKSNVLELNNSIAQTQDSQAKVTPEVALQMLVEGNNRFVAQTPIKRDHLNQVTQTAEGQFPFAAVLSCIDSRIPTELIFDQGIGDIFNARIAGNFVNEDILGSLEFACKLAGSKVVVVMGHTSCGAVKGACADAKLGNLTQMLAKIKPAVKSVEKSTGLKSDAGNIEFVNKVAMENVKFTIADIKNNSQVLNEMMENGEIEIVGAIYDVASGKVSMI